MAEKDHTIRADWRVADAVAAEERVKAIEDWLEHTDDLVLMFEGDEALATELRSISGIVKSRRNDFSERAAKLRAEVTDRDWSPD